MSKILLMFTQLLTRPWFWWGLSLSLCALVFAAYGQDTLLFQWVVQFLCA